MIISFIDISLFASIEHITIAIGKWYVDTLIHTQMYVFSTAFSYWWETSMQREPWKTTKAYLYETLKNIA